LNDGSWRRCLSRRGNGSPETERTTRKTGSLSSLASVSWTVVDVQIPAVPDQISTKWWSVLIDWRGRYGRGQRARCGTSGQQGRRCRASRRRRIFVPSACAAAAAVSGDLSGWSDRPDWRTDGRTDGRTADFWAAAGCLACSVPPGGRSVHRRWSSVRPSPSLDDNHRYRSSIVLPCVRSDGCNEPAGRRMCRASDGRSTVITGLLRSRALATECLVVLSAVAHPFFFVVTSVAAAPILRNSSRRRTQSASRILNSLSTAVIAVNHENWL